MNASSYRFAKAWLRLAAIAVSIAAIVRGEPFVPADDQQVLERLRSAPFDATGRELRALHSALASDRTNAVLAITVARRYLESHRATGDPRLVGRAHWALTPWWQLEMPPLGVLILRATIKQTEHEFASALLDLDAAIRRAPHQPQAWLTRASTLLVLGRYDDARQACLALAQLDSGWHATVLAAQIASLTGGGNRAQDVLRQALTNASRAPAADQLWGWTLLAETAARMGNSTEADESFQRALALPERDIYLLASYSDFLLDQGRASEAIDLLEDRTEADPLLLRLCLAESATRPSAKSFHTHTNLLSARFDASRMRGGAPHQREEARFRLHLLGQPEEALRLALENWKVQKEPADTRILLEAAWATGEASAAAPALEFLRRTQLEDIHLARLAHQLNPLLKP